MDILRRRGWELPEHLVTPEALVLGRRSALAGAGAIALATPASAMERNAKYAPGRFWRIWRSAHVDRGSCLCR